MEVFLSLLVLVDIVGLGTSVGDPFGKCEGSSDFLFLEVGEGLG
jgi:hypothetical protein